jgi:hypothetical protein
MRQAILSDIAPKSAIEWLLTVDVIELSWEIERYRLLRHKSLMQYREQAIEKSLRRIDLLEIPSESDVLARQQIRPTVDINSLAKMDYVAHLRRPFQHAPGMRITSRVARDQAKPIDLICDWPTTHLSGICRFAATVRASKNARWNNDLESTFKFHRVFQREFVCPKNGSLTQSAGSPMS